MSIPDFLGAFYFYKYETLTDRCGRDVEIKCQEIGMLILPTGSIVACDGLIPSLEPFNQRVATGSYPVILSFVLSEISQHVACAMLRFSDTMPKFWKSADPAGQNPVHGIGYGVDTGTGCFADLAAMQMLLAAPDAYERLREKINSPYADWIDFRLDDAGTCNIIAFSSGHGDGCYPSFFGYDSEGNLVCLATDFGILAPLPDVSIEPPSKFQLHLDF